MVYTVGSNQHKKTLQPVALTGADDLKEDNMGDTTNATPSLEHVLESAARLQELVPGAVLVGGSAAAYWAGHRLSMDHDHVLTDLSTRFDTVFDSLNHDPGWSNFKAVPGKIILGRLDGVEAGIRQLRRSKPLETERVTLMNGTAVTVPTLSETMRVKAYFVVARNQVRDYVDVAALGQQMTPVERVGVITSLDGYYADIDRYEQSVSSTLVEHLAAPDPRDSATTRQLKGYKGLRPPYDDWDEVVRMCRSYAREAVSSAQVS